MNYVLHPNNAFLLHKYSKDPTESPSLVLLIYSSVRPADMFQSVHVPQIRGGNLSMTVRAPLSQNNSFGETFAPKMDGLLCNFYLLQNADCKWDIVPNYGTCVGQWDQLYVMHSSLFILLLTIWTSPWLTRILLFFNYLWPHLAEMTRRRFLTKHMTMSSWSGLPQQIFFITMIPAGTKVLCVELS